VSIGRHETPNKGATDIWLTPISIVRSLGVFDLDPCAWPGHPTAKEQYFERGLEQEWAGRVWLNPPYSEVGKWLNRLADHGMGIALVFARTDTKWFHQVCDKSDSVFFPAGRLTFLKSDFTIPSGNAGAPSVFLSFGEKPNWKAEMKGWVAK